MDDGGRCLLDVIGMDIEGSFPDFVNVKGDPSALQSFLEGGDELKLSSSHLANSLEGSPLEVDYSLRTNGSHLHDILVRPVLHPSSSPQVGHSPFNQHAAGQPPPSPAPSPFSVPSRSPIQLSPSQPQQNNTLPLRSPRPCASPSTHAYPPTPSPGTPLYQTKSPAPTASPLSYPLSQSRSPAGSTPALSPAPPGAPVATTLNLATTAVGSPMVQFLPAPVPQSAVATASRPHMSSVKPIQPKQPQILPKPAAGSPQFGAKPVTVNHRNATVAVGPAQANQIVIGAPQNQAATAAVLPNAVGGQGTLLLNHISLGLAPNPQLVFQGGAGGLQNLQLVVRPQQAGLTTANPSSQPPAHTNPGALNQAAFLQALQVQNHAAQQALINQAKSQQTVMIPGGANLLTSTQALSGRQNVLLSTRLVNTNQGPLQLQTFQTPQGPVTVAIAPQQNIRNIQNLGMPMGQMGQMLQGMAVTQAPQTQFTGHNLTAGVMLNSHPVTSVSVSPDLMPTLTPEQPPPPPPPQPPKVPSVNLEELLKQTGIVPSDPPPPLPSPSLSTTHTTCPSSSVVVSLPSGHLVTTQAPSISQGAQVMLNTMQNMTTSRAPSQLMAQLQQSIALSQPQMKLSIAQDGSVYLQRPIVQTVQALPQGVQPSTIPVSLASDTATSTNVPSVLLQRLNATPQNATVAVAAAADGSASLIPLTVQNLNLAAPGQGQALLSAAPGNTVSAAATMVPTPVVTTSTSSGLMQMHPTLVQSLTKASAALPPVMPKATPIAPQPPPPPPPAQPQVAVPTSLANQNVLQQQLTSGTTVTFSQTLPVVTTTASTIAKTEPTNVIMSSPSLGSLPIGSKLQTIQLSPQNQELLQKVQCQLRPLLNLKSPSVPQRQMIQQLQVTQNKILSQGKVIACHPAPAAHSFQLQMHPQIQPQPQPQLQPASVAVTSTSAPTTSAAVPIPSTVAGVNVQCSAMKPVNLTNILKQNSAPAVTPPRPAPPPIQAPAATTITVPAQIKVNNQVVNLTPQQRQTIQQQLKTLTPDNKPNLLLGPPKQAVILKLQQPAPILPATTAATVTPVPICTSSSPAKSSAPTTITVATSTGLTGGILVIQPNRGIKRPAPTPISQAVLLQQQLASDQAGAINPDCKTPFRSGKDACRRLLKYHVFNSKTPTQQDLQKADDLFETVSEQLVEKAHQILSKYRCMLLKQSMREYNTSEVVMLNKLLIEDERRELEQDRQAVKEGKDLNLPPPPDHWLPKLNAVADLCTTSTTATVHLASTLTSTPGAITTTSIHVAPLSSVDVKPFRGNGPPALKVAATTTTTPVVKQEEMGLGEDARTKGGSEGGKGGCVLRIKQEKIEDEEPAREEEPPDKNYDEWAAIQKELEMYPLGNGETASDPMSLACSHVDFDDGDVTPEDSCTGLADFEPPVAKAVASAETMDTSSDWEVFASSSERRPSLSGESAPIVAPENLLGCGSANSGRSRTKNEPGPSLMDAVDPKSPEDDLNAQVQCAINSILNLQRGEDVLPFVSAAPVSNNICVPEEEEEEEEEDDDDEDFALEAMDTSKDEQMTIDYEASAVEVERCEVDDALEEAVKSILM